MELTHGRSSALFTVLAGFSILLIIGRKAPKSGVAGRQAIARVAIRALVLLVLGPILTYLDTSVDVILAYYGICFLLVLPLYRLSAQQLGWLAAATALVLPQVRSHLVFGSESSYFDPVFELMVSGDYPAITWAPFVIAGMAIARLDLSTQAMHWRLGLAGGALAVSGHGGSCSRCVYSLVYPPLCRSPPRGGRTLATFPGRHGLPHLIARRRSRSWAALVAQ
ncbi:heparan-alpha-glucosaminide N-acetyltransferase domain-containing protein [Mesorhizobium sp. M1163]